MLKVVNTRIPGPCPLNCSHCSVEDDGKDASNPSTEVYPGRYTVINMFGGDPLCNPAGLRESLFRAPQNKTIVNIFSTGYRLPDELDILRGKTIFILIYHSEEHEHDEIAGLPGAYQQTLKNIDVLISNNIKPVILYYATRFSIGGLPDIYEYCMKKGLFIWILGVPFFINACLSASDKQHIRYFAKKYAAGGIVLPYQPLSSSCPSLTPCYSFLNKLSLVSFAYKSLYFPHPNDTVNRTQLIKNIVRNIALNI